MFGQKVYDLDVPDENFGVYHQYLSSDSFRKLS
jgi:hypothetical protein